jgi:hypothetical protein
MTTRLPNWLTATCLTFFCLALSAQPIQVPRYDDADEYLPQAERRNKSGIRLFLRQQEGEELVRVASPRNVTVDVIARMPPDAEMGVVFFLGGTSVLSIVNERLDRSFSFQPRSRDAWWQQRFATFLVDAPSDRLGKAGIEDAVWRTGTDHARDLQAVLDEIARRFKGRLVLHGHSNGAVSLSTAAQLHHPQVRAYMMSGAAHQQPGGERIQQVEYTAPVLLVQHRNDTCRVSSHAAFEAWQSRIRAPLKKVLLVEGGIEAMSGPCGPFAAHSFVGQEATTIQDAIGLLKSMIRN